MLRSIAHTLHMHPTLNIGESDIIYVIYRYTFISQAQALSMKVRFHVIVSAGATRRICAKAGNIKLCQKSSNLTSFDPS